MPQRIQPTAFLGRRETMNVEHHRERGESHTERPQRPGHPCGGTGSHPAYSSILFRCSFRHNTTLQDYRLLDVTAPVTKALLCPGAGEVPRISLPRTLVNTATPERARLRARW